MKSDIYTRENLEIPKLLRMLGSCCTTPAAAQALASLEPFDSLEAIEKELRSIGEIHYCRERGENFTVKYCEDIAELLERVKIKDLVLEPEELLDVAAVMESARTVLAFCRINREKAPLISDRFGDIPDLSELRKAINKTFDDDGEVEDDASENLRNIRRRIRTVKNRITSSLDKIIRDPKNAEILSENIVTIRNDRYVIPVRSGKKHAVKGIVHQRSSSGASLYIEPNSVIELNNEMVTLFEDEREEIRRILIRLTEKVSHSREDIRHCCGKVAEADLLKAKAVLAAEMTGVPPKIDRGQPYFIKEARHPLLDLRLKERWEISGIEGESTRERDVVPVDVDMTDGIKCLIITGPNTGGKTAVLKTVGLFTVMAHLGLYIPAEEAHIPFLNSVFADIGDIQSLINNLSTFSGHIRNISRIIENLTEPSLVLLDEVGSGTDPEEGAALALAIVDYFIERDVTLLVSSHKSQLKIYAGNSEKADNATVDFDRETLQPTYRLIRGIPGRSNALHIARSEGIPAQIIEEAGNNIGGGVLEMDRAIKDLESERFSLERSREKMEETKAEAERLKNEMERERQELDREKTDILKDYYKDVRSELEAFKGRSEKALAALKDQSEAREKVREMTGELREISKKAKEKIKRKTPEIESDIPVVEGAKVLVKGLGLEGAVKEIRGDDAEIESNGMRMTVPVERLAVISQLERKKPTKGAVDFDFSYKDASSEINLRGKTVEEALAELDKFIDDAVVTRLKRIRIVHGKGTGTLRKAVETHLRNNPHVADNRTGEPGEGGTGVTIANLE